MSCTDFTASDYDLYVLGLLDDQQRGALDGHVTDGCSVCLEGVQRSMRLWSVFTSTLQDAEPSAAFTTRLTQISELSGNVLTFPKNQTIAGVRRDRWPYVLLAGVLIALAVLGGWRAGRASTDLEEQRLSNQVARLTQEVATLGLQVQEEENQRKHLSAALHSSENASVAAEAARLAGELTRSQAEANQYKALLDREQSSRDEESALIEALSAPGVKTIALKGAESAAGYAMVVPKSKLIFMASNLPKLPAGKRYQLWVTGKQDSSPASAAVFEPNDDGHVFLQIEDAALASDAAGAAVTDEPAAGSAQPTGSKVLAPETVLAK